MEAVLEHVSVLSFPSLGQYKTILSKHQLTVETGEVRGCGVKVTQVLDGKEKKLLGI